ncbi:hypothetical protein VPHD148_0136 [Vibrio phage D148]
MLTEVQIWEMDNWSGRSAGETLEFKTSELAKDFVKKFNERNNLPTAPEYYEYAEVV